MMRIEAGQGTRCHCRDVCTDDNLVKFYGMKRVGLASYRKDGSVHGRTCEKGLMEGHVGKSFDNTNGLSDY